MSKQRTLGCKLSHYKLCQLGPEQTPGEGCPEMESKPSHPVVITKLKSTSQEVVAGELRPTWGYEDSLPVRQDKQDALSHPNPRKEKCCWELKHTTDIALELGVLLHNPQDFSCVSQLITEHHFLPGNFFSRNWRGTGLVSHFCT